MGRGLRDCPSALSVRRMGSFLPWKPAFWGILVLKSSGRRGEGEQGSWKGNHLQSNKNHTSNGMFRSAWYFRSGLPPRKCPNEVSHLLWVFTVQIEKMQSGDSPQRAADSCLGEKENGYKESEEKVRQDSLPGSGNRKTVGSWGRVAAPSPVAPGTVRRQCSGRAPWWEMEEGKVGRGSLKKKCWAS